MIDVEGEGCAEHQRPGYDRPDGDEPGQSDKRDKGPKEGDHAGGDIDDALQDQQAPALAVPRRLDARDNGEYAIDQHVGREQDDEHPDRDPGRQQADQPKKNAQKAA